MGALGTMCESRLHCEGCGCAPSGTFTHPCLYSRNHGGQHSCDHHTWPNEKEKVPVVKRNAWGVPMADEVIERQGCCKKVEEKPEYLDLNECSSSAENVGGTETKQCPYKAPHKTHDWCFRLQAACHCRGVEKKVPEKGTRENPYRTRVRYSWLCQACLASNDSTYFVSMTLRNTAFYCRQCAARHSLEA